MGFTIEDQVHNLGNELNRVKGTATGGLVTGIIGDAMAAISGAIATYAATKKSNGTVNDAISSILPIVTAQLQPQNPSLGITEIIAAVMPMLTAMVTASMSNQNRAGSNYIVDTAAENRQYIRELEGKLLSQGAELGKERSERYADSVATATFEKMYNNFLRPMDEKLNKVVTEQAVTATNLNNYKNEIEAQFISVNKEIRESNRCLAREIEFQSELAERTYLSGELVLPSWKINHKKHYRNREQNNG